MAEPGFESGAYTLSIFPAISIERKCSPEESRAEKKLPGVTNDLLSPSPDGASQWQPIYI